MSAARWQAVAWDVDGTLVDSEPLHHRALVAVCAEVGLDLSNDPPERFVGLHMHDVWLALREGLAPRIAEVDWLDRITEHYCAHAAELTPMAGAVETVTALARDGVPQIAVSNSGRRVVDATLSALDIGPHVALSVSLDDVAAGKPDPEPYLQGAARLGLLPARVLAVEDSATGMASARSAGLGVAAFAPRGCGLSEADVVLSTLTAVLPLVMRT